MTLNRHLVDSLMNNMV